MNTYGGPAVPIRTLPVRQYALPVNKRMSDDKALSLWPRYARIRGWSPGRAQVTKDPHTGQRWLLGLLVEWPGFTLAPDVGSSVNVNVVDYGA